MIIKPFIAVVYILVPGTDHIHEEVGVGSVTKSTCERMLPLISGYYESEGLPVMKAKCVSL